MKTSPERLAEMKDNTYYDQTGKQILVGDLLKVYHFNRGKRKYGIYIHLGTSPKILKKLIN